MGVETQGRVTPQSLNNRPLPQNATMLVQEFGKTSKGSHGVASCSVL